MSQGLLLCWSPTCGRNPARSSTLQTHLRVAQAAVWHYTGRLARLVRFDRRKGRTCSPGLERRGTTEQHAQCTCSRCTACFRVKLNHDVFISILQGQAHQPPGTGVPDSASSDGSHVKEYGAKRLLVHMDSRVVLGAVSKGRSGSRKIIASKTGVLVSR